MKKIGLVISGIGFENGTSVWDVAYALEEIERCSGKPIPLVPRESIEKRIPGSRRKSSPERDFLKEAQHIVRGDVYYMNDVDPRDLDLLLIPGGEGCITVLSSLKRDGMDAQILPELRDLIIGMFVREKQIGTIGYGAALVAFVLRTKIQPIITVGDDAEMVELLKKMGSDIVKVQPHEVVFDPENHILSTPGTSPKSSLYRAALGIEVLITELLECKRKKL